MCARHTISGENTKMDGIGYNEIGRHGTIPVSILLLKENPQHGSQKEINGVVLDHIFYFNGSLAVCHLGALALAHAHYTVCCYVLCAGTGHYVTAD